MERSHQPVDLPDRTRIGSRRRAGGRVYVTDFSMVLLSVADVIMERSHQPVDQPDRVRMRGRVKGEKGQKGKTEGASESMCVRKKGGGGRGGGRRNEN